MATAMSSLENSRANSRAPSMREKSTIMGEDHTPLDPEDLEAYEIDPKETKALLRTLDWHIAPVCMVLYLIAFLDRSNIGMYMSQLL